MMNTSPPERVQAWRAVMHVHAAVTETLDETLRAEVGIPGSWYEALVEIAFAGGNMRMNEFAVETTLTKSGATRFVDRLEEAGLVERRLCPTDRRAFHLSLTDEGRRVQKAADKHVLRVLDERFGRYLSDEEAKTLLTTMTRIRQETLPIHTGARV